MTSTNKAAYGVYGKKITTIGDRTCLRCNKLFASHGPHNRICNDCKKGNPPYSREELPARPTHICRSQPSN